MRLYGYSVNTARQVEKPKCHTVTLGVVATAKGLAGIIQFLVNTGFLLFYDSLTSNDIV